MWTNLSKIGRKSIKQERLGLAKIQIRGSYMARTEAEVKNRFDEMRYEIKNRTFRPN